MKKKRLRKIIKALKMEIARLEELNVREEYDLLNSGSISGPSVTTTGESLPKEQSSTEMWKEYFDKPQKGVFDHPKYRSPFFNLGQMNKSAMAVPLKEHHDRFEDGCIDTGQSNYITITDAVVGNSNINGNPV